VKHILSVFVEFSGIVLEAHSSMHLTGFLIVCLRVNLFLFSGKFTLFFLILKLSYVASYSVS